MFGEIALRVRPFREEWQMEDLTNYLDEIVEPTIKDFAEHPTSVRHAFLACVATFHSVDYLAYDGLRRTPRKGRVGNLKKTFGKESPEFHRIDQIAHAFKHVVSDGTTRVSAAEVISRPPAMAGVMVAGLSMVGDTVGGVTLGSDHGVDLLNILRRAVEFLRTQTGPRRSRSPAR
jgi:hypothetical protein